MKRIVWTFGLIAGAVLSLTMFVSILFKEQIGFDKGLVVGYTSMVAAYLMVYFGIRTYRDNVLGGTIRFGRAFQVGILITLVACVCYVVSWQVISRRMAPDYMDRWAEHELAKARAAGASQPEIDAKVQEMARWKELYRNPFLQVAMTFAEPFPPGLLITLVCAGVLSRARRRDEEGAVLGAASAG